MKKQILIVGAVLVVAGLIIWYGIQKAEAPEVETITHTFTSESGESIQVIFDNETNTAVMTGKGFEELVFAQAISASGARYENKENDLVLWNKGNDVTLYDGEEEVFSGTTDTSAVEENEGSAEADESLEDSAWVWQYTDLKSDERMEAPEGERFVMTFEGGGNLGSTTDCNSIGGNYVLDGEVLSIGELMMTKMYCEGSMEGEYAEQLGLVNSYMIEGDTLRLNLNRDYGAMVFKRQ